MVCIISCNNPVQAAPMRLNSSNRASDQAHSQQQARADESWSHGRAQPSTIPFSQQPGNGEPPPRFGVLGHPSFAAEAGYAPPMEDAVAPQSIPRDAKEGQAQRKTLHSHLQTSLINHQDREPETGAGRIDTGWLTVRAAEPQDQPRQVHTAQRGEKQGKRIQSTSQDQDKSSFKPLLSLLRR